MQKTANRQRSVRGRDVFTTGEVAKICKVTIRTVIKWFEAGKLEGYRIPESKDRRIPRQNLLAFLKEHGFPYDPKTFDDRTRVLVADDDPAVLRTLSALLAEKEGLEVHTASSGYEAGFQTARLKPRLLLIDYYLGDTTADQVIDTLARDGMLEETGIVVMTGGQLSPAESERIESLGIRMLRKPVDFEALKVELRAVLR